MPEDQIDEAPLRLSLSAFLASNPEAKLEVRGNKALIVTPWGDPTLVLDIASDDAALHSALNAVRMPPRLTALWHTDSKDLELIFTAFPIDAHLYTRRFTFRFGGRDYPCEYYESSPRLLAIAKASRPIEPPNETDHRHLHSFYLFQHYRSEHPDSEQSRQWRPISFWIRDLSSAESEWPQLLRHLNFFMSYFDPKSPRAEIHQPQEVAVLTHVDPIKAAQEFPPHVAGKAIDPFLLRLWESSREVVDPFRRFLYQYQVVEYCSFYHLQDEILREIHRAVAAPDLPSRVEQVARTVLEAVTEDRMEEARKVQVVLERHVRPEKLWEMIQPNASYFSEAITFEGGLKLQPLIKREWGLDDFKTAWSPKFADSLRMIRNGLVHAREKRMSGIIAPTSSNHALLRPWLAPLMVAAVELMIYGQE